MDEEDVITYPFPQGSVFFLCSIDALVLVSWSCESWSWAQVQRKLQTAFLCHSGSSPVHASLCHPQPILYVLSELQPVQFLKSEDLHLPMHRLHCVSILPTY